MAQKAVKQLAARNAAKLRQLHAAALVVNGIFLVMRVLVFRRSWSWTGRSALLYVTLSAPAWLIELLFERNSRPVFDANSNEVKRAGDDLDARGLTDYMHDVLYYTWACVVLAALLGDKAWWAYLLVPIYSAWLAFSTFGSMRQGLAGLTGGQQGGAEGEEGSSQKGSGAAGSKRQQKLEKRGGQRVQYR